MKPWEREPVTPQDRAAAWRTVLEHYDRETGDVSLSIDRVRDMHYAALVRPNPDSPGGVEWVQGRGATEVRALCELDAAGERTLELAARKMGLSARAHDRVLKVARTLADLAGEPRVAAKHVAEAVQYRSLDRDYWT